MNLINIYDHLGVPKVNIKALDSSELFQQKNIEDKLVIEFKLNDYVLFKVNDYVIYNGVYYYLRKLPKITEENGLYTYSTEWLTGIRLLEDIKYLLITDTATKTYYDNTFAVTRTISTLLDDIISLLNDNKQLPYVKGAINQSLKDIPITKTVSNWNLLQTIGEFLGEVGCDWYLDTTTNTLNFDSKQNVTNGTYITVSPGLNNGLNYINRLINDSDVIVTRVYGYGGTTNMPPRSVYDSSQLKENRLDLPTIYLEQNVGQYGIIEEIKIFDDITPTFTGKISDVISEQSFSDNTLTFNPNDYLINNQQFKVSFKSGLLQGIEFTVNSFTNNIFNLDKTTFAGEDVPNANFYMQAGDTYTLLNLNMPTEYIEEAQVRLSAATQDYLNSVSKPKNTFELKFDAQFLNKIAIQNGYELTIGDLVHVVSYANDLNDLFEIKQIRKKLNNIYDIEVIIGDTLPKTLLSKIKQVQFQSNNNYSNIVNNQTIINNNGGTFEWEII